MSKLLLWKPSPELIKNANITHFQEFVNNEFSLNLESYRQLYEWSIQDISDFWVSIWKFVRIIASENYNVVVEDLNKFPGTKWFVGAKLNFAENLLRFKDNKIALAYSDEKGRRLSMTYAELNERVASLAQSLRETGLVRGDTVAAYMPNQIETIIAMLASTSIGAIWSTCGAELGTSAVIDRIGQIRPKVLFAVDKYLYKGKNYNILDNLSRIVDALPTLERVIIVENGENDPLSHLNNSKKAVLFDEFTSPRTSNIVFEQLPFDYPVYVMFSSGTTGKPKSIVQGAGGVLLNHLKELIIHCDVKRSDKITYLTSPSWMMWNWLVSALGTGSTIFLYNGDPNYPTWEAMWNYIQSEKVTIFGCSASYINNLKVSGARPSGFFDLSMLREISQTGSPLSSDGFEWVYLNVKKDIHFNSMSGGTDLNGCFAVGNPSLPVYAGEVQAAGLGMKIAAYDEKGEPVLDKEGELVCEAPSPSMPLYFWNDPNNVKYLDSYFSFYKNFGKNVWRHGDFVTIHSDTCGITFHGRSDAVLKPSGVRIGTAEIYNVVEKIHDIVDSLAVGQNWKGDQRIILFVQLSPNKTLTDELKSKIRQSLREQASPRHVPALIFQVPGIPYTFSGKKVEISIANLVNGKPITNTEALADSSILSYFVTLLPDIQRDGREIVGDGEKIMKS